MAVAPDKTSTCASLWRKQVRRCSCGHMCNFAGASPAPSAQDAAALANLQSCPRRWRANLVVLGLVFRLFGLSTVVLAAKAQANVQMHLCLHVQACNVTL